LDEPEYGERSREEPQRRDENQEVCGPRESISLLADKDPNILDSETLFVSAAGTVSARYKLRLEEEERKKKAAQQETTGQPATVPAAGAQPSTQSGLGTPAPKPTDGQKIDLMDPTLTVAKLEAMGVHQKIEGRPITDADLALLRVLGTKRNRR